MRKFKLSYLNVHNKHDLSFKDTIYLIDISTGFHFLILCIVCKEAAETSNLSTYIIFSLSFLYLFFLLNLSSLHPPSRKAVDRAFLAFLEMVLQGWSEGEYNISLKRRKSEDECKEKVNYVDKLSLFSIHWKIYIIFKNENHWQHQQYDMHLLSSNHIYGANSRNIPTTIYFSLTPQN